MDRRADREQAARGLLPARRVVLQPGRAGGPPRRPTAYGAAPLHAQSHGESFVALAANRFAGEGLYLLDEPEAALSVTGSLAFIEIMHVACTAGAQFIVATHSPILLALPGARILEFADGAFTPAAYDELSLVQLHRSFLAAPERFLRHLL